MGLLSFIPVIGNIIDDIFKVVDKSTLDKDKALELKTELKQVITKLDYSKYDNELQAKVKTVLAEEQGKSWLQRNWRPGLMALFGLIIANNYIIAPYIQLLFGMSKAIMLPIPPDMWGLLKLGISGYIVGRSAEKVATTLNLKKKQNDLTTGNNGL